MDHARLFTRHPQRRPRPPRLSPRRQLPRHHWSQRQHTGLGNSIILYATKKKKLASVLLIFELFVLLCGKHLVSKAEVIDERVCMGLRGLNVGGGDRNRTDE